MKVAYLLVTTACLMGAQQPTGPVGGPGAPGGAPPKMVTPAPIAPGSVTPAPVAPIAGGDCGCSSCNTCDSCGSSSYWTKFKGFCGGLFHRNSCDSCGSTCAAPCSTCAVAKPSCFSGCAQPSCSTCGNANWSCNESCGCGSGHRFKELWGRMFNRHNDCECNTCSSCGGGYGSSVSGGTVIVPKGAESIPAPKDGPPKQMPSGEPPQKQVQILNPSQPLPVPAPTFDAPPAAPAISPAIPSQERPF